LHGLAHVGNGTTIGPEEIRHRASLARRAIERLAGVHDALLVERTVIAQRLLDAFEGCLEVSARRLDPVAPMTRDLLEKAVEVRRQRGFRVSATIRERDHWRIIHFEGVRETRRKERIRVGKRRRGFGHERVPRLSWTRRGASGTPLAPSA
jgi:hypothetical protein